MYARDVSRRRSPLSLSPLQVKTAAEKKEEEEEERRARTKRMREREKGSCCARRKFTSDQNESLRFFLVSSSWPGENRNGADCVG